MTYDYLRARVVDDYWLSKPALKVSSWLNQVLDIPTNFLQSLAPIQAIGETPETAFLLSFLDNGLVTDLGFLLLESSYAVNKAFNSEKYAGRLASQGSLLGSPNSYNQAILEASTDAQGLLTELETPLQAIAQPLPHSPQAEMEAEENRLQQLIDGIVDEAQSVFDAVVAQIQAIAGEVPKALKKTKRQAQNKLNHFKRVQAGMKAKVQGSVPRFALTPIDPTGTSINVIQEIASWLLGNFLQVPIATEALAWVVSSTVIKYLGGIGADAARYFAASVMKGLPLPTLINPTGMFAGCWGLCQAYAPYLIIAGVLVVMLIRAQNVTGDYLHVFGLTGNATAYGSAKLYDSSRLEVVTELRTLANLLRRESPHSFDDLLGFAADEQNNIVLALNLRENKAVYQQQAIAEMVTPFLPIIKNGINWQVGLAESLGGPELTPIDDPDWEDGNLFDPND